MPLFRFFTYGGRRFMQMRDESQQCLARIPTVTLRSTGAAGGCPFVVNSTDGQNADCPAELRAATRTL